MNKKNIILVAVSLALFAAAGLVLFYGRGGTPGSGQLGLSGQSGGGSSAVLLPKGTNLDLGPISELKRRFKSFDYPLLSPSDVGAQIPDLLLKQIE